MFKITKIIIVTATLSGCTSDGRSVGYSKDTEVIQNQSGEYIIEKESVRVDDGIAETVGLVIMIPFIVATAAFLGYSGD